MNKVLLCNGLGERGGGLNVNEAKDTKSVTSAVFLVLERHPYVPRTVQDPNLHPCLVSGTVLYGVHAV